MRRLGVPLLVLCAFAAGCGGGGGGGDDGNADEVRAAIKTFAQASVDRDFPKACEQFSKSTLQTITKDGGDCPALLKNVGSGFEGEAKRQLDKVDDLEIEVKGNKATAKDPEARNVGVDLIKENGAWKIDLARAKPPGAG